MLYFSQNGEKLKNETDLSFLVPFEEREGGKEKMESQGTQLLAKEYRFGQTYSRRREGANEISFFDEVEEQGSEEVIQRKRPRPSRQGCRRCYS